MIWWYMSPSRHIVACLDWQWLLTPLWFSLPSSSSLSLICANGTYEHLCEQLCELLLFLHLYCDQYILFAAHAACNASSSSSSSNTPDWACPSSEPSCSLGLLKEVSDICDDDTNCGTDGIRSDSMVFNFWGTTHFHQSNTRPSTVICL